MDEVAICAQRSTWQIQSGIFQLILSDRAVRLQVPQTCTYLEAPMRIAVCRLQFI